MPPVKQKPSDLLTLIVERAEALRKAGVASVQLDGCSFTLTPYYEPPAAPERREADPQEPEDPLSDPATFGLRPGSRLPGFSRDEESEEP